MIDVPRHAPYVLLRNRVLNALDEICDELYRLLKLLNITSARQILYYFSLLIVKLSCKALD